MAFSSPWVGPGVLVTLIIAVITTRIFGIGEEILAWGIVSIITYLLFIIWSLVTAPSGPLKVPVSGPWVTLTASLMMGYSIHDFLVQNLIKNPKRS